MEYKYKYLHICAPSTRMLKGFIVMLNNHFNTSEHYFLCRTTSDGLDGFTTLHKNVINWKDLGRGKLNKFIGAIKAFKASQNIIIHGFTFSMKWMLLLYLCRDQLRKKGIWIVWGADLYNYRRKSGSRLFNMLVNHIEESLRISCRTSVVVFPTDISVFKRAFGEERTLFCAPLGFSEISFSQWDHILEVRRGIEEKHPGYFTSPDRRISIQVGHNAFPFNEHAKALTALEHYKENNILITMPMSYGNDYGENAQEGYEKDTEQLGKNLFGPEKIRVLKGLLPLRKYNEFLGAVDVAILCAPRQNALGNIIPLLYMGKKIFLSKDNPLFSFFRKIGFEIHDVMEISTVPFKEFISPVKTAFPHPWIKNIYSIEWNAQKWEVVFGYSDGRYTREEAYAAMDKIDGREKQLIDDYLKNEGKREKKEEDKKLQERVCAELMQLRDWLEKREAEDQKALAEKEERKAEWKRRVEEYVKTIKSEEKRKKEAEPNKTTPFTVRVETKDSGYDNNKYILVYKYKKGIVENVQK